MKTKTFAYILIILVYTFPFRYAVISPTGSNAINLLCMIATVIGTLVFIFITSSDGNRPLEQPSTKINNQNKSYKEAA